MIKKHTVKLISVLMAISMAIFINAANATYNPSFSIEHHLEVIKVNKDASVEQTLEGLTLIKTQKGIEEEGQQHVTFNSKLETIKLVDAYVIQPDGKRIKVPESSIKIKDDDSSGGAPMFTEMKRFTIIYPEVKIGSKLFYKFKSFQHTPEFKGEFYTSHFFSPHYEYKDLVIDLSIHKDLPIKIETKGMTGGLISGANEYRRYRYKFEQKKTHIFEPTQSALEDFAPYFTASTFKDWASFGQAYQKGLEDKTVVTPAIQQLANKLTQGLKDESSKVRAIHNWVSQNIRYVAVYLGNGGVVPHDAETILNNRYGDCKDHAVLLETLLKSINIESSSALINLGDAYTIPKLAVLAPFNHVINYIPSLNIYLDSTAQYSPYETLPSEDMDKPVVLTKLNKIGHTPKFEANKNIVLNVMDFKVQADGSIQGTSHSKAKGYFDVDYRGIRANHIDDDESNLVSRRLSKAGEAGTGKITTTSPADLNVPFSENTSFVLDPVSNIPGHGAMKIPRGISFNMFPQLTQHKPIEKMDFPSQCYSFTVEDRYKLSFPSNVAITRLPENVNYQGKFVKYQASYRKEGNNILATRYYEENHSQAICGSEENEEAKKTYKVLVRDLRNQIFYQ